MELLAFGNTQDMRIVGFLMEKCQYPIVGYSLIRIISKSSM
jgi:hypothetical protein